MPKRPSDATTFDELASAMRELVPRLRADVNKVSQEVAKRLVFRLINETPVDTSAALSNWQLRVSRVTGAVLPPYNAGSKGSTAGTSSTAAYAAAVGAVTAKKPTQHVINIFNNIPHIDELNAGKSKQASAGFVQNIVATSDADAKVQLRTLLDGY